MGWYDNHVLPRMLNAVMRADRLMPYRTRAVGPVKGRVLEIGVGSGVNLPLYSGEVSEVIGLDPHGKLLEYAAGERHSATVRMVRGSAEAIPLKDASVDAVVVTWALCSIPNVKQALSEMRRVLRPGGELRFVEHGLAPEARVQGWQHRLTPAWKHLSGGCHLDRPIDRLVREAGFEVASLDRGYMRGPRPLAFMYEGVACKSR